MSMATQGATMPAEDKAGLGWLGYLVVGVIAYIIVSNVFHFLSFYWVYEFSGQVTSVSQEQICIEPGFQEWSFVARWWYQKSGPVCGEVALDNFDPVITPTFSSSIESFPGVVQPEPKNVRAGLTWLTNANGDRVKTYLFIQQ